MKTITSTIKENIVNYLTATLWSDMVSTDNREKANKVFNTLIQAYNEWQEGEHFGVEYLFNLNDKDDLICVVKGGMNSKEIAQMVMDKENFGMTNYFFFGENYTTPKQLTTEQVASLILTNINAIVSYTLAYGAEANTDSFKFIYKNYIATLFNIIEEKVNR